MFEGMHVDEGKNSVAITVTLQPREKPLTDWEINKMPLAIVATIEKATVGVLRT